MEDLVLDLVPEEDVEEDLGEVWTLASVKEACKTPEPVRKLVETLLFWGVFSGFLAGFSRV